jgi:hypothetical protein
MQTTIKNMVNWNADRKDAGRGSLRPVKSCIDW